MENNVIKYKNYLLQENEKTNLVSRKSSREEIDLHLEDSIKIFNYLDLQDERIIDVGSGAGFPGLIMAIKNRQCEYTLLESDLKKSNFLKNGVNLLQLDNVQVIRNRAEELGQDTKYREKFDICTSRAVAEMNLVLEYCMPLIREGGMVLLWKGPRYEEEIERAANALDILGGTIEEVFLYQLGIDRQRAIVKIRKNRKTPQKYPRRTGLPTKRPL